jgi:hypothetical protein
MVENLAVLSLVQKYLLLYWNPASRYVDRMMESPRAWEEQKNGNLCMAHRDSGTACNGFKKEYSYLKRRKDKSLPYLNDD